MTRLNLTRSRSAPSGQGAGAAVVVQRRSAAVFDMAVGIKRQRRRLGLQLSMPLVLLALWEVIAALKIIDPRFFSAPSSIVSMIYDLAVGGELWPHVGATMYRVVVGFAIGAVIGTALGVAMGLSWIVRAVIQPVVGSTYPIPKIAILPVLLLVFGVSDTALVVLAAIAVAYQMLINTAVGVASIPPIYSDVAKVFDVSRSRYLRTVVIPGSLPVVFAAIRLSWGMAMLVIVAAEFTSANEGVGQLIMRSWQLFNVEQMYSMLVVTALIGWLSFLLIDGMERLALPWRTD